MNRFVTCFLVAAALAFSLALPFHAFSLLDFSSFSKLFLSGEGATVFIGNSVIRAKSRCDTDGRSIPDLYAEASGRRVIDLSRGGMRSDFALKMVELGVSFHARPPQVFFALPLDLFAFEGMSRSSALIDYFQAGFGFGHRYDPPLESHLGIRYGNYSEFSKNYFVREKSLSQCPEGLAANNEFAGFMYHRNFVAPNYGPEPEDLDAFVKRLASVRAAGVNVSVVLMPVNFDDMSALLGADNVEIARSRIESLKSRLGPMGIVDASALLSSNEFTDRWCACGHLNDLGRRRLVEFIRSNGY